MLKRLFLLAVLAGVAGLGIFWWLTIPAVVAASSLPAYKPNLANGLTTFNAGGCSSCHAVPNQPDRLKLGGGLPMPSPFGTFNVPNISPDPKRRHRAMERGRFRHRRAQGHVAVGRALFSGVSLRVLPAREGRRHQGSVCLSEDAGAGEPARRATMTCRFRSTSAAMLGVLEIPVHRRQAVHAGCQQIGAMESRRLSRQQPRPLRGVPQPAQFPRRHRRRAALCRRAQSGRRGLGAQHHPEADVGLERKGFRLFPRERDDAGGRHRRRLDGARDPQHLAIVAGGSRRDGGISEIAARRWRDRRGRRSRRRRRKLRL